MPWTLYQEGLYLTGLWSISLMSLAMVLATRPTWLERPLSGMDRIYRWLRDPRDQGVGSIYPPRSIRP